MSALFAGMSALNVALYCPLLTNLCAVQSGRKVRPPGGSLLGKYSHLFIHPGNVRLVCDSIHLAGKREEKVGEAVEIDHDTGIDGIGVREADHFSLRSTADRSRYMQGCGGICSARQDELLQRFETIIHLINGSLHEALGIGLES